MSTTTMKARKPKWHPTPPPPPSPKILNLPRRTRLKQPKTSAKKQPSTTTRPHSSHQHHNPLELHQNHRHYYCNKKGKLESLFGQEREFSRSATLPILLLNSSSPPPSFSRRERVEDDEGIVMEELSGDESEENNGGGGFEVEKWKFQAEILRAECNFLRMEREFALKKLERNRKQMERALRSAVHTLLNGRERIFEGKNETAVLKEETEHLAENLKKLQKNSRFEDIDLTNCNNFDKEACRLQQQLEKLGGSSDEKYLRNMEEILESSLRTDLNHDIDGVNHVTGQKSENKSTNNVQVELLRSKMEGLSMGIVDRTEEYRSLLSTTADSSVASSASASKRMESSDFSAVLSQHLYQETKPSEENKCSGRCKAIVRRIVEQVRAETEQWSQMQAMLGQVRKEMEDLQVSRDFWEDRSLKSDHEIQVLQSSIQEWKQKAFSFEAKANELETKVSKLKAELECSRAEPSKEQNQDVMSPQQMPLVSLCKHLKKVNSTINSNLKVGHHSDDMKHQVETARETMNATQDDGATPTKAVPPLTLGKQLAKEKRLLQRCLKENRHNHTEEGRKQEFLADGRRRAHASTHGIVAPKRLPFRDIGNSSPLAKQNTRAVFPLHSPNSCKTGELLRISIEKFQSDD